MNPFDLVSSTGLGSCLMIALGVVGIPLAIWWEKRKGEQQ